MPTNTGSMSQLLTPGLRKIFFQWLKDQPTQYDKYLEVHTSSRAYEEDLLIAGLGTMPQKVEGTPITYQDPIQGNKKRYTHLTYGLGFRVTREMYDDDLYGPMQRMSRELARSGYNAREVLGANVINLGLTSTATSGFTSGESLFYATAGGHVLLGGGTFANRASTDADLGISALEAAVINFNKQVDERNFPIMVKPKLLLIPPDLQMIAEELLGSEYRPYTATNEINAVRKYGINYMLCHYLTDSNSWALLASTEEQDLNFFEREALNFQSGDDFDTGDAKFKGVQRMSAGFGDWRGTYGSSGAS